MNCYGQYAGDPAQRKAAYIRRMLRLEGNEQIDREELLRYHGVFRDRQRRLET